jgi:hypothetical protein
VQISGAKSLDETHTAHPAAATKRPPSDGSDNATPATSSTPADRTDVRRGSAGPAKAPSHARGARSRRVTCYWSTGRTARPGPGPRPDGRPATTCDSVSSLTRRPSG